MSAAYSPVNVAAALNRRWVRLAARKPMRLPAKAAVVSFSFDDFPRSAADTGARILSDKGYRATYYASAGLMGSTNHLGALWKREDLLRLAAQGHEIGCHSYGHLDCARASAEALENAIDRNAEALRALGHEAALTSFAFPYGEASAMSKRMLAQRFTTLRSVRPGVNRGAIDRAYLRATGLDGGEAGVSRALHQLADVNERGGWLIFYLHDIRENHSEWGARPSELSRVVDAVVRSGVTVSTVGEASQRLAAKML